MSEYNRIVNIPLECLNEKQLDQAIYEWGETPLGREILRKCIKDYGLHTAGCNVGRKSYLDFIPEKSRKDIMIKLLETCLKIEGSNILLNCSIGNPRAGYNFYRSSISVGFFEEFYDKSEKNFEFIRDSIDSSVQNTGMAEELLDLYSHFANMDTGLEFYLMHDKEGYDFIISIGHPRCNYDEHKELFEKCGMTITEYGIHGKCYIRKTSLNEIKEEISKIKSILLDEFPVEPYEIPEDIKRISDEELIESGIYKKVKDKLFLVALAKSREFGRTKEGNERMQAWIDGMEKRQEEFDKNMLRRTIIDSKTEKINGRLTNRMTAKIDDKLYTIQYVRKMINGERIIPYILMYGDDVQDDSQIMVESLNARKYDNVFERVFSTIKRLQKISPTSPVIIPMIPLSDYTDSQQLSLETVKSKYGDKPFDEAVLHCIMDGKKLLSELNPEVHVKDKVFWSGYSTSGVFAQRFAMIHPEIIDKCLVGGAAGTIPIPDKRLSYPLGVRDFEELFGREFDEEEYKKIQFAYYVGEHEADNAGNWDQNGELIKEDHRHRRLDRTQTRMPMHDISYKGDATSASVGKEQRALLGEDINTRFINSLKYYVEHNYSVRAKIYKGIGHRCIFDKRDNPNYDTLIQDMQDFYFHGDGFEKDEASADRIDLSRQRSREERTKEAIREIEQLER